MLRFPFALSAIAAAVFVAGCNGAATSPPTGATASSPQSTHAVDSGIAQPHVLRLFRTPPHPPARRHVITGAERARARAGGWQPVSSVPSFPNGPQTEELMTDGTVLVFDYCGTNVYKLTPDKTGSYVTGTWTQLASLPSSYAPLYFASAVLPDGKLIINGGEYNFCNGTETTLGAIYDPVGNTWTAVSPPSGWSRIGDGQSAVLSNGTYMIGNCCTSVQAQLNESTMTWTQVGTGKADTNSEEGWSLLPSGEILTADVGSEPNSELFSPKTSSWQTAGTLPVNLTSGFEIGPQTLRPNNTVWVAGASGLSAVYHIKTGSWTQGPTFPLLGSQQLDVADGPSTLLTDGTVMVAASPGLYNAPSSLYIYNGKKLKSIPAFPQAPNDSSYNIRLLMLPTGQVLEDDGSLDMEVYTPHSLGSPSYAPQITSVPSTLTHGNTYSIMGRRFNGVSQANMYGDDVQQATNYPLVRITNAATGHIFYARTHNHSYMGVGSNKKVSTMFDVPSTIETGASSLVVVTNGIASAPSSVTIQ
jgi:hypothetical protein